MKWPIAGKLGAAVGDRLLTAVLAVVVALGLVPAECAEAVRAVASFAL